MKLKEIATVKTGLVLSRKESKDSYDRSRIQQCFYKNYKMSVSTHTSKYVL